MYFCMVFSFCHDFNKMMITDIHTAWKVSKYGVISGPYFPVFGPEITPYLDTFHTVSVYSLRNSLLDVTTCSYLLLLKNFCLKTYPLGRGSRLMLFSWRTVKFLAGTLSYIRNPEHNTIQISNLAWIWSILT